MKKSQILVLGVAFISCCVLICVFCESKWGRTVCNNETKEYISASRTHVSDDPRQKNPEETRFPGTATTSDNNERHVILSSQAKDRQFQGQYKRLTEAYGFEMDGRFDEALEKYQAIAELYSGSEQIGAVNRYGMALRRKFNDGEGFKKEIIRIRDKRNKTAFELAMIARYKGSNEKKCYRTLLNEYPDSALSEYAEMKLSYSYDPIENGSVETFLPIAIQSMDQFIKNHPDSAFVPHAKLRIASCYEVKKDLREEAERKYKQLLQDYSDNELVCAHSIIGLYWLGVFKDSDLYKTAAEVGKFYGTYGNGYFLRNDFDLENTDLSRVRRYIRKER